MITPWFRDKDLIAYWSLDEGSGNIIYDYSINNNYGTLFNGVIWRSGLNCKSGNCLEFDGIDDYVLGGMNNFDIQPNKTFALWVYPIGANGCTISFKEPNQNLLKNLIKIMINILICILNQIVLFIFRLVGKIGFLIILVMLFQQINGHL